MQDRIEESALELLHAIREHHPDIYAGAWVNPYTAALEAGLNPDSSSYRVAMEYLRGPPGSERRRRPCYTRIVPAGLCAPYPSPRLVSLAL
jgi:hypothetical protein